MESLEGAHEKFLDRIANVQIADQPYAMKYVAEIIVETNEDEDLRELTKEDKSFSFSLLKTVEDVLNKTVIQRETSRN
jgi:hypothetical protein